MFTVLMWISIDTISAARAGGGGGNNQVEMEGDVDSTLLRNFHKFIYWKTHLCFSFGFMFVNFKWYCNNY